MSLSFASEDMLDCLEELCSSLRRRLEISGVYAHSFYAFYLLGTLRSMNMDFNASTMEAIRSDVRDKTEARDFMERAGAECPLLGSWYLAPAERKMYRAECRA